MEKKLGTFKIVVLGEGKPVSCIKYCSPCGEDLFDIAFLQGQLR